MVKEMINKSIWLKGIRDKKCNTLKNDIKTDILIIGGGITGLSSAYFLKDSGYDVTLVDSSRTCYGQSSNSTGKLTYLQGSIYEKISDIYDIDYLLRFFQKLGQGGKFSFGVLTRYHRDQPGP